MINRKIVWQHLRFGEILKVLNYYKLELSVFVERNLVTWSTFDQVLSKKVDCLIAMR